MGKFAKYNIYNLKQNMGLAAQELSHYFALKGWKIKPGKTKKVLKKLAADGQIAVVPGGIILYKDSLKAAQKFKDKISKLKKVSVEEIKLTFEKSTDGVLGAGKIAGKEGEVIVSWLPKVYGNLSKGKESLLIKTFTKDIAPFLKAKGVDRIQIEEAYAHEGEQVVNKMFHLTEENGAQTLHVYDSFFDDQAVCDLIPVGHFEGKKKNGALKALAQLDRVQRLRGILEADKPKNVQERLVAGKMIKFFEKEGKVKETMAEVIKWANKRVHPDDIKGRGISEVYADASNQVTKAGKLNFIFQIEGLLFPQEGVYADPQDSQARVIRKGIGFNKFEIDRFLDEGKSGLTIDDLVAAREAIQNILQDNAKGLTQLVRNETITGVDIKASGQKIIISVTDNKGRTGKMEVDRRKVLFEEYVRTQLDLKNPRNVRGEEGRKTIGHMMYKWVVSTFGKAMVVGLVADTTYLIHNAISLNLPDAIIYAKFAGLIVLFWAAWSFLRPFTRGIRGIKPLKKFDPKRVPESNPAYALREDLKKEIAPIVRYVTGEGDPTKSMIMNIGYSEDGSFQEAVGSMISLRTDIYGVEVNNPPGATIARIETTLRECGVYRKLRAAGWKEVKQEIDWKDISYEERRCLSHVLKQDTAFLNRHIAFFQTAKLLEDPTTGKQIILMSTPEYVGKGGGVMQLMFSSAMFLAAASLMTGVKDGTRKALSDQWVKHCMTADADESGPQNGLIDDLSNYRIKTGDKTRDKKGHIATPYNSSRTRVKRPSRDPRLLFEVRSDLAEEGMSLEFHKRVWTLAAWGRMIQAKIYGKLATAGGAAGIFDMEAFLANPMFNRRFGAITTNEDALTAARVEAGRALLIKYGYFNDLRGEITDAIGNMAEMYVNQSLTSIAMGCGPIDGRNAYRYFGKLATHYNGPGVVNLRVPGNFYEDWQIARFGYDDQSGVGHSFASETLDHLSPEAINYIIAGRIMIFGTAGSVGEGAEWEVERIAWSFLGDINATAHPDILLPFELANLIREETYNGGEQRFTLNRKPDYNQEHAVRIGAHDFNGENRSFEYVMPQFHDNSTKSDYYLTRDEKGIWVLAKPDDEHVLTCPGTVVYEYSGGQFRELTGSNQRRIKHVFRERATLKMTEDVEYRLASGHVIEIDGAGRVSLMDGHGREVWHVDAPPSEFTDHYSIVSGERMGQYDRVEIVSSSGENWVLQVDAQEHLSGIHVGRGLDQQMNQHWNNMRKDYFHLVRMNFEHVIGSVAYDLDKDPSLASDILFSQIFENDEFLKRYIPKFFNPKADYKKIIAEIKRTQKEAAAVEDKYGMGSKYSVLADKNFQAKVLKDKDGHDFAIIYTRRHDYFEIQKTADGTAESEVVDWRPVAHPVPIIVTEKGAYVVTFENNGEAITKAFAKDVLTRHDLDPEIVKNIKNFIHFNGKASDATNIRVDIIKLDPKDKEGVLGKLIGHAILPASQAKVLTKFSPGGEAIFALSDDDYRHFALNHDKGVTHSSKYAAKEANFTKWIEEIAQNISENVAAVDFSRKNSHVYRDVLMTEEIKGDQFVHTNYQKTSVAPMIPWQLFGVPLLLYHALRVFGPALGFLALAVPYLMYQLLFKTMTFPQYNKTYITGRGIPSSEKIGLGQKIWQFMPWNRPTSALWPRNELRIDKITWDRAMYNFNRNNPAISLPVVFVAGLISAFGLILGILSPTTVLVLTLAASFLPSFLSLGRRMLRGIGTFGRWFAVTVREKFSAILERPKKIAGFANKAGVPKERSTRIGFWRAAGYGALSFVLSSALSVILPVFGIPVGFALLGWAPLVWVLRHLPRRFMSMNKENQVWDQLANHLNVDADVKTLPPHVSWTFLVKGGAKNLYKKGRLNYENILIRNNADGRIYRYVLPSNPYKSRLVQVAAPETEDDSKKFMADVRKKIPDFDKYEAVRTFSVRKVLRFTLAFADEYMKNENYAKESLVTRELIKHKISNFFNMAWKRIKSKLRFNIVRNTTIRPLKFKEENLTMRMLHKLFDNPYKDLKKREKFYRKFAFENYNKKGKPKKFGKKDQDAFRSNYIDLVMGFKVLRYMHSKKFLKQLKKRGRRKWALNYLARLRDLLGNSDAQDNFLAGYEKSINAMKQESEGDSMRFINLTLREFQADNLSYLKDLFADQNQKALDLTAQALDDSLKFLKNKKDLKKVIALSPKDQKLDKTATYQGLTRMSVEQGRAFSQNYDSLGRWMGKNTYDDRRFRHLQDFLEFSLLIELPHLAGAIFKKMLYRGGVDVDVQTAVHEHLRKQGIDAPITSIPQYSGYNGEDIINGAVVNKEKKTDYEFEIKLSRGMIKLPVDFIKFIAANIPFTSEKGWNIRPKIKIVKNERIWDRTTWEVLDAKGKVIGELLYGNGHYHDHANNHWKYGVTLEKALEDYELILDKKFIPKEDKKKSRKPNVPVFVNYKVMQPRVKAWGREQVQIDAVKDNTIKVKDSSFSFTQPNGHVLMLKDKKGEITKVLFYTDYGLESGLKETEKEKAKKDKLIGDWIDDARKLYGKYRGIRFEHSSSPTLSFGDIKKDKEIDVATYMSTRDINDLTAVLDSVEEKDVEQLAGVVETLYQQEARGASQIGPIKVDSYWKQNGDDIYRFIEDAEEHKPPALVPTGLPEILESLKKDDPRKRALGGYKWILEKLGNAKILKGAAERSELAARIIEDHVKRGGERARKLDMKEVIENDEDMLNFLKRRGGEVPKIAVAFALMSPDKALNLLSYMKADVAREILNGLARTRVRKILEVFADVLAHPENYDKGGKIQTKGAAPTTYHFGDGKFLAGIDKKKLQPLIKEALAIKAERDKVEDKGMLFLGEEKDRKISAPKKKVSMARLKFATLRAR